MFEASQENPFAAEKETSAEENTFVDEKESFGGEALFNDDESFVSQPLFTDGKTGEVVVNENPFQDDFSPVDQVKSFAQMEGGPVVTSELAEE